MDNQTHPEFSSHQNRDSNLGNLGDNFQDLILNPDNENRRESNSDTLLPIPQNLPQQINQQELPRKPFNPQSDTQQSDRKLSSPNSPTFSQLPLTEVKVLFPQLKESMLNSYMVYRVNFIWNGQEFEVGRRFSDFQQLRTAVKNCLPFSYVFPMHRKQMIVG